VSRTLPTYQLGLALLLLAYTLYLFLFAWNSEFASFADDSASYLLLARKWSPWITPTLAELETVSLVSYPPGFPLLLALSGASTSVAAAQSLVLLCLGIALYLYGRWLPARLGQKAALLMLGFYCLVPGGPLASLGVLSENSYLLFSMASLLVLDRARDNPRSGMYVLLCACLAATLLTRSIGIALIIAVALGNRQWKTWASCAGALLILLLWQALGPATGQSSYVEALLSTPLSSLWGAIQINLFSFAPAFHRYLAGPATAPLLQFASLAILAGCLCYTGLRAWRQETDALYCLGYLGILLLWPYPVYERFLHPIMPLLLAQPLLWHRRHAWPLLLCLLPAIAGQASLFSFVSEATPPQRYSPAYYRGA